MYSVNHWSQSNVQESVDKLYQGNISTYQFSGCASRNGVPCKVGQSVDVALGESINLLSHI